MWIPIIERSRDSLPDLIDHLGRPVMRRYGADGMYLVPEERWWQWDEEWMVVANPIAKFIRIPRWLIANEKEAA